MSSAWSISWIRSLRGATLALSIATAGALGCGDGITEPEPEPAMCDSAIALLDGADPQPFAFGDLREAFLHAAGPMVSALGSSQRVDQLRQAINALGASDDATRMDTVCRSLRVATESLAALEDHPETLPDRDAIRLVLILAAGAMQAGQR